MLRTTATTSAGASGAMMTQWPVCVCACMRVFVRACVRACVRVYAGCRVWVWVVWAGASCVEEQVARGKDNASVLARER
jgi:hypothetical protein